AAAAGGGADDVARLVVLEAGLVAAFEEQLDAFVDVGRQRFARQVGLAVVARGEALFGFVGRSGVGVVVEVVLVAGGLLGWWGRQGSGRGADRLGLAGGEACAGDVEGSEGAGEGGDEFDDDVFADRLVGASGDAWGDVELGGDPHAAG